MAETVAGLPIELPADWRERLRHGVLPEPDHRREQLRFGGLAAVTAAVRAQLLAALPPTLSNAAVLLPITQDPPSPSLLLTVRASHLRRHAGQISFPGGQLEERDVDVAAAAIRETTEEIGIEAEFIQPIGFLPDLVVQTGYRITPVVALLRPGYSLSADSTEVAEIFELPLAVALTEASYLTRKRVVRELEIDGWELPYGSHQIWGATAGILRCLCAAVGMPRP